MVITAPTDWLGLQYHVESAMPRALRSRGRGSVTMATIPTGDGGARAHHHQPEGDSVSTYNWCMAQTVWLEILFNNSFRCAVLPVSCFIFSEHVSL